RPRRSRNSTRSSPRSLIALTGLASRSAVAATGNQYRRSNVPMGVPGPTRVNRSFSSRLSIGVLPSAPPDRLGAHSLLRLPAFDTDRGPGVQNDRPIAREVKAHGEARLPAPGFGHAHRR